MFVNFSLADPNYQGIIHKVQWTLQPFNPTTNHRKEYATSIILNRSLLTGKYKLCSTYAWNAFEGRKMFLVGDVVQKRINLDFMVSDVPTRPVLGVHQIR